jgi:hypothetical protein
MTCPAGSHRGIGSGGRTGSEGGWVGGAKHLQRDSYHLDHLRSSRGGGANGSLRHRTLNVREGWGCSLTG